MPAKIISLAQAKGGVGKSTICANLAVTLAQTGSVLVIDCDPPQNSLVAWYGIRDSLYQDTDMAIKLAATPKQLHQLVKQYQAEFDYIVIDGAPHVNPLVRAMLMLSHLVIVPLSPSPVEIWSFESFDQLLIKAMQLNPALSAKVCWNRVRQRVKASDETIQQVGKSATTKAFKNQLTLRAAYLESFAEGCGVYEWDDPVASAEVWSLGSAVKRSISRCKPVNLVFSASVERFIKKG